MPRAILRRQALVEVTRQPAPTSYDVTPRNRGQRRALEREMRTRAKLNKRRTE
jgi:hypothetical protein